MKQRVAIFGAGGFAKEVFSILQHMPGVEPVLFVSAEQEQSRLFDLPVMSEHGFWTQARGLADSYVAAVGDPVVRAALCERAATQGLPILTLVHQRAFVDPLSRIGAGSIIYPGAIISAAVEIGRGVLVNSGATVGHDTQVGDFCSLNPGAHIAGRVVLGERTLVGIGAVIIEKLAIGANTVIGAGSVVIRDIPGNSVAVGVPAKVIKQRAADESSVRLDNRLP